eukprot:TRINITY_DN23115_c0_g1_i2.p1 TRINITY_DN23115_c0_g1~~TRINITY_DN23115_c0_g1_i2.p1  ORF type:complete len:278 (-),score=74.35 TRINITY_DN23115_c0_g1_i2:3-836(-)
MARLLLVSLAVLQAADGRLLGRVEKDAMTAEHLDVGQHTERMGLMQPGKEREDAPKEASEQTTRDSEEANATQESNVNITKVTVTEETTAAKEKAVRETYSDKDFIEDSNKSVVNVTITDDKQDSTKAKVRVEIVDSDQLENRSKKKLPDPKYEVRILEPQDQDEALQRSTINVTKVHNVNITGADDEKLDVTVTINGTEAYEGKLPKKPDVSVKVDTKDINLSDPANSTTPTPTEPPATAAKSTSAPAAPAVEKSSTARAVASTMLAFTLTVLALV